MSTTLEDFRKYESMIAAILSSSPVGEPFCDALLDRPTDSVPEQPRSVARPIEHPLACYSWIKSFQLRFETISRAQFGRWEETLRSWCDQLESDLTTIAWPASSIPARDGGTFASAAWIALTLSIAGKVFVRDAWTDLAADTFGRIHKRQLENGALLDANASDNTEIRGYDELVILHACASYAVQSEDRAIAKLVARATEFHAREIQPDHSTNQPWALFAFIWNTSTRATADAMLHASSTQTDAVSLLLLADALYCLRLFTGITK